MESILSDKERSESIIFAHQLSEALNSLGLTTWLAYGSSLGAVREGQMIEGDNDIDLMIWEEDFKKFREMLSRKEEPFTLLPPFYYNFRRFRNGGDQCKIILTGGYEVDRLDYVNIDVFSLKKSPDGIRCYCDTLFLSQVHKATRWGDSARRQKLYHYENLKKIKFGGLDFYVSKYVEKTLDFIYNGIDGTNNTWRTPVSEEAMDWDKTPSRSKDDEITGCVMGAFDLFHIGHLRLLERSSKIFDKVVAAVHSDEVVMEYKKVKPVIPYEHRVEIVNSCKYVDEVIEAPLRPQTVEFLNKNNLDYLVHGKTEPKFLEEHYSEIINENRLLLLDETEDYHTTDLRKRIKQLN